MGGEAAEKRPMVISFAHKCFENESLFAQDGGRVWRALSERGNNSLYVRQEDGKGERGQPQ
jgi:hypothetical protein